MHSSMAGRVITVLFGFHIVDQTGDYSYCGGYRIFTYFFIFWGISQKLVNQNSKQHSLGNRPELLR